MIPQLYQPKQVRRAVKQANRYPRISVYKYVVATDSSSVAAMLLENGYNLVNPLDHDELCLVLDRFYRDNPKKMKRELLKIHPEKDSFKEIIIEDYVSEKKLSAEGEIKAIQPIINEAPKNNMQGFIYASVGVLGTLMLIGTVVSLINLKK